MLRCFLVVILALFLLAQPAAASDGSDVGQDPDDSIALYAASGDLEGGYYFVCDCGLGNDLKFYVPLEWAHDVFTQDSTGDLVNLSASTCYAYCPAYPDYTFSCSRFGTFTFRATNYNTTDLLISDIKDTNMTFLDNDGIPISDREILFLIAALIFILCGILIIRRR